MDMSGRIKGTQTLAMPMLHSTTIQTPAGTRVHDASVWTRPARSGNLTTQEMQTLGDLNQNTFKFSEAHYLQATK